MKKKHLDVTDDLRVNEGWVYRGNELIRFQRNIEGKWRDGNDEARLGGERVYYTPAAAINASGR